MSTAGCIIITFFLLYNGYVTRVGWNILLTFHSTYTVEALVLRYNIETGQVD